MPRLGRGAPCYITHNTRYRPVALQVNINMNDVGNDGAFQVWRPRAGVGLGAGAASLRSRPRAAGVMREGTPEGTPQRAGLHDWRSSQETPSPASLPIFLLHTIAHRLLRPSTPTAASSCWTWEATTSARTEPRRWQVGALRRPPPPLLLAGAASILATPLLLGQRLC